MNENPFLDSNFLKDIKRSFVPTKLFNRNKYNYNIINVDFKIKKNNIVYINLRLKNGNKYEHIYVIKNNNSKNKNMNIDKITEDLYNMMIDDD
jgi:hypothetical protein